MRRITPAAYPPYAGSAVKVTCANEARREDFARQVRAEHEKIAAGDAAQASAAATEHMEHEAERVRLADRECRCSEGGEFARRLASGEEKGGA